MQGDFGRDGLERQHEVPIQKNVAVRIADATGALVICAVFPVAERDEAVRKALLELEAPLPAGCEIRTWEVAGHLMVVS